MLRSDWAIGVASADVFLERYHWTDSDGQNLQKKLGENEKNRKSRIGRAAKRSELKKEASVTAGGGSGLQIQLGAAGGVHDLVRGTNWNSLGNMS